MLNHNVTCCNNWQVLLPGGRWNSHYRVLLYTLADVMARWQMDCYIKWQMLLSSGRWNSHRVNLIQFQFWGVKLNLIPYVWQMVLAYVFIEGWIINPYEQCLFYPSVEVLVFPLHYVEIFNGDTVTSGVKMVIYRGVCLETFLEPLSKCSWGLSSILFIALHPVTLVSVDDSTFLLDAILVLRSHQEVLDSVASFKIHLYPMFPACVLEAFTDSFVVGNHHVWFLDVVTRVLLASTGFVCYGLCLHFYFVYGPCRIIASC